MPLYIVFAIMILALIVLLIFPFLPVLGKWAEKWTYWEEEELEEENIEEQD